MSYLEYPFGFGTDNVTEAELLGYQDRCKKYKEAGGDKKEVGDKTELASKKRNTGTDF